MPLNMSSLHARKSTYRASQQRNSSNPVWLSNSLSELEIFYNTQRRHSVLAYLRPVVFERQIAEPSSVVRASREMNGIRPHPGRTCGKWKRPKEHGHRLDSNSRGDGGHHHEPLPPPHLLARAPHHPLRASTHTH